MHEPIQESPQASPLPVRKTSYSVTMAAEDEGAPPPPAKPKVAKYWTEFFFSSVGAKDFSYSVFRVGTAELSAHDIVQMVMECCVATNQFRFNIGCTVCDGESEHRSFQDKIGTISSPPTCALCSRRESWTASCSQRYGRVATTLPTSGRITTMATSRPRRQEALCRRWPRSRLRSHTP